VRQHPCYRIPLAVRYLWTLLALLATCLQPLVGTQVRAQTPPSSQPTTPSPDSAEGQRPLLKEPAPLPSAPSRAGGGQGVAGGTVELLTPTQGVDFSIYLSRVSASVKRNWYAVMPESARLGDRGKATVQFRIMKNGAVPEAEPVLAGSSGKELLDRAALSSVRASSPFEPLPSEFRGPFIELRFAFLYNMPPKEAAATAEITSESNRGSADAGVQKSPNEETSQENKAQIPESSNPPPAATPQTQPDQSSAATLGRIPTRIKQGGNVTASSIISQAPPVYPPLARQARIQGNVVLHVIIDKDGNVKQIDVVSGHPLLIQSAVEAVKQWRYKRTLLNGTPVEVDTTVTVTFTLGDSLSPQETSAQGLQDSCDAGNAVSCVDLGFRYANGQGITRDDSRAVLLFQKGCDGGDARGCGNLGTMYANGQGVTKDESHAMPLFQKGCEGGNAAACRNLGFMYEKGQGVAKDKRRASELYQKACAMGYAEACAKVKK
jgi:TonB family protein